MKSVVLIGYPCAGKSTAMEGLEQIAETWETGDFVREMHEEEEGHKADSQSLGEWSTEKREEDSAYATRAAINRIECTHGIHVFSGVRCMKEINLVRDSSEDTCVIYIDTSFEERFQRFSSRGREGEETREELKDRDEREDGWGLEEILIDEEYDYKVNGDLPEEELKNKVKELVKEHHL